MHRRAAKVRRHEDEDDEEVDEEVDAVDGLREQVPAGELHRLDGGQGVGAGGRA